MSTAFMVHQTGGWAFLLVHGSWLNRPVLTSYLAIIGPWLMVQQIYTGADHQLVRVFPFPTPATESLSLVL